MNLTPSVPSEIEEETTVARREDFDLTRYVGELFDEKIVLEDYVTESGRSHLYSNYKEGDKIFGAYGYPVYYIYSDENYKNIVMDYVDLDKPLVSIMDEASWSRLGFPELVISGLTHKGIFEREGVEGLEEGKTYYYAQVGVSVFPVAFDYVK